MLVFYDLISNYIFVKNVFIREGQTSSKILSTILIFFRGILGFSTGFLGIFPPKPKCQRFFWTVCPSFIHLMMIQLATFYLDLMTKGNIFTRFFTAHTGIWFSFSFDVLGWTGASKFFLKWPMAQSLHTFHHGLPFLFIWLSM